MKLVLEFEGYYQNRITTDPDPTDEPRGVSGYTFALAGEPDLDNIVRMQPDEKGVHVRPYGLPGAPGPQVGVTVRRATRDGNEVPELTGAKVQFLNAQILEHNGILVRNDYFVIDPLHVIITQNDKVILERTDILNLANPNMPLWEATSEQLLRRQPKKFTKNSAAVAEATGLPNADNNTLMDNRRERRKNLMELRAQPDIDAVLAAALDTRIEQLAILEQWWNLSEGTWDNRPIDRRAYTLGLQLDGWDIDVNGPVTANAVGGDPAQNWPLRFWMGGWDGDALCAYVKGSWEISLA